MTKKKNKKKVNSNPINNLRPFVNDNKVILSFVGGAMAGIALASIFGSEKSKEIVEKISSAATDLKEKVSNNFADKDNESNPQERGNDNPSKNRKTKREEVKVGPEAEVNF